MDSSPNILSWAAKFAAFAYNTPPDKLAFKGVSKTIGKIGDNIVLARKLMTREGGRVGWGKAVQASSFNMQGDIALANQQYKDAVDYYTQALKIVTDFEEAFIGRAEAHFRVEQYQQAIADYSTLIDKKPTYSRLHYRGCAYYNLEDYENAVEDFTACIDRKPNHKDVYQRRVWAYQKLEKFAEALSDLEKIAQLDPDNLTTLSQRSITYIRMEAYDLALADLDRLIENDYYPHIAQINKAYVLSLQERHDEAAVWAEVVLRLDIDDPSIFSVCGYIFECAEEYLLALEAYGKAIAKRSDYYQDYYNRAYIHRMLENYEEALADYTEVIRILPDWPGGYSNRGYIYFQLEQYDNGLADFDRVLELDPDSSYAYTNRGYGKAMLERYEDALADLQKVLEIKPDDNIAYWNMGDAYYDLQRYPESLAAYREYERITGKLEAEMLERVAEMTADNEQP